VSDHRANPTIALVGRPNVGKSTLFNRLIGGRTAIVASTPGVTRDRREGEWKVGEKLVRVIDTGGLSFEKEAAFSAEIEEQVAFGIEEADTVWLVVDGESGVNPYDQELSRWLKSKNKRVVAIVNKIDNHLRRAGLGDFYSLAVDAVMPVSAMHGTGIDDAIKDALDNLPQYSDIELEDDSEQDLPIRIAFLGKPNVGKSSLVNKILGESRMIVSNVAGTTREAIELPLERKGVKFRLIDTAGIRRKSRTKEHLEKVSALNAINTLRKTDVAVLVLDSLEEVADQDAKVAGYILDAKTAIVIVLNKWDQVPNKNIGKEIELDARDHLRFLPYAHMVRCSAFSGMGLSKLFQEIKIAYKEYTRRVQTADLNRVVQLSVSRQPPPAKGYVPTKVFYGSQIKTKPPTICLFTNHIGEIRDSYTRYMENQFRYHFGFQGTPLIIQWKGRKDSVKKGK